MELDVKNAIVYFSVFSEPFYLVFMEWGKISQVLHKLMDFHLANE